jgi:tryptophan synthase beta chain
VILHQTVVGQEAKKQMEKIGEYPDVIIGCAGGGRNFAGLSFPFVSDKINGKDIAVYAVEPTACPTMTRGPFVYDHGDTARFTPLLPMHSLGHAFVPPPIHAGGLRYHGMAPLVSQLVAEGIVEARSYYQIETFEAGMLWAKTEGFIPAPETNQALACVVDEAKKAKEEGKEKVILVNWSGHGLIDLGAYERYLSKQLDDYELPDEELQKAEQVFKDFPKPDALKSR